MKDLILFEKNNGVAMLTLNRPKKLNALNYATNDLLMKILDKIEDDPVIRAVILTGAGRQSIFLWWGHSRVYRKYQARGG